MSKTVLIVDDNPLLRRAVRGLFEASGIAQNYLEAVNGVEAVVAAAKHHPDLIILDLSMPVMNGAEAARELKNNDPDIPIILFTQYASDANALTFSDLPVDAIAAKGDSTFLLDTARSLLLRSDPTN